MECKELHFAICQWQQNNGVYLCPLHPGVGKLASSAAGGRCRRRDTCGVAEGSDGKRDRR
eukprot:6458063-Amphidinium_carterae.1